MTSLYISPDKPSQPSMGNTERIWKHMCSTVSVYDIAGDKVLNLSCPRHGHICVGRRTSLCHSNPRVRNRQEGSQMMAI